MNRRPVTLSDLEHRARMIRSAQARASVVPLVNGPTARVPSNLAGLVVDRVCANHQHHPLPPRQERMAPFVTRDNELYLRICEFYRALPYAIALVRKVREQNSDCYVGFLSRDAYFLYRLYKLLYPELREDTDYGFVYSSRACFTTFDTDHYHQYIRGLMRKRGRVLFVDVWGTGNSFLEFVSHYNLRNISLLFLVHHRQKLDPKWSKEQRARVSAMMVHVPPYHGNHLETFAIERAFRSPFSKVYGVTSDFQPITHNRNLFDAPDIVNDHYAPGLVMVYEETLRHLSPDNGIQYRTLTSHSHLFADVSCVGCTGLLALDIDGTITGLRDETPLREMIQLAHRNKVRILLVTSRQCPFMAGPQHRQTTSPIPPLARRLGLVRDGALLQVWYNPHCFLDNVAAQCKQEQIMEAARLSGIDVKRVLFIDDHMSNVAQCSHAGIVGIHARRGVDQRCLERFRAFFGIV